MLSRRCSRTIFRKSLRKLIPVALLFLAAGTLSAQLAHRGRATFDGEAFWVEIEIVGADEGALVENLRDGLTARATFFVRLVEPRPTPFGVLGPRVVAEYTIDRNASFDPFSGAFVITGTDGFVQTFDDRDAFLRAFFALAGHRVSLEAPLRRDRSQEIVVEFRIGYRPIVFVPALGILSIFLSEDRDATSWTRVPLQRGAE